ncbi:MAG: acyl-CoA thioesterase [Spirochaetes bacterium]|nr:acyl-CoA thioesterase [Spirochaetota bacterium]
MYSYPVTVEFEDVDSYNITHHTKLIAYLERARVHFFADNNIDLNNFQYGLVLRNMNIQFKQPLFLMDKVNVELRVKYIDKLRFEWDYKIVKNAKTAVSAAIEQVVIDVNTKKIVPIPEKIKSMLEKILI